MKISESTLKTDNDDNNIKGDVINTLTSKFAIDIHAVYWTYYNLQNWKNPFILELSNIATESIVSEINKISSGYDFVSIPEFKHYIGDRDKSSDPNLVFKAYQLKLEELCEKMNSEWRTLILWFSFFGCYELLPYLEKVIKELKNNHKNLIFIMWWSDFSAIPDKIFLEWIFNIWIDVVNIWWASEFVNFFWKLTDKDIFFRDTKDQLRVKSEKEIPQNLIFAWDNDEIWEIRPWKKIWTASHFNELTKSLYFAINNSSCLNNCHYCANQIHDNLPLTEKDIDNAICDCNEYILRVKAEEFSLTIESPNPLQYIDKFERFVNNLDLSRVKSFWFFGDFMWMWKKEVNEKVIVIIDNLLQKWPDLLIIIHFSMDAFHYKNDWEFLWRTLGKNVASEDEFIEWFKNFQIFYEKYSEKNSRVAIPFNIMYHPKMELADYKERQDFIDKHPNTPYTSKIFALFSI